ncbi:hypothetical protein BDV95DRAFT_148818 [Massariosphaeria phaeospora]|uniref:Zn(2)-C6 fungal-type domain-containing protein n=1 Tax=Massariosphaeria phaeospora TaxID=100035 RepID=A0A7C8MUQ9_9PLEO|nr:hypothetical protein BDV95DRAFT_148818 [Massariosphaeria phaeospora]
MSGYYPPNQHMPPQYYHVNPNMLPNPNLPPNVQSLMAPERSVVHGMPESPVYPSIPGPFTQYGESQIPQAYMDQYEDLPGPMGTGQGANGRMRRRAPPGDHVKHRRTRSGCFTCRQRRVKCDETHPMCERCRKGNRECVYPEPQSNSKASRSGSKSGKSSSADEGSSPENHEAEIDPKKRLAPILDDDEEEEEEEDDLDDEPMLHSSSQEFREPSNTPSLTLDRSPSPSTENSSVVANSIARPAMSRRSSNQTTKIPASAMKSFPGVSQDVKFYLSYFQSHMSHHHYSLKRDDTNFLKTDFLQQAMKYEPLRYAVVGYAAYFHTLSKPNGHISTFLQYYNESVSRLRASITKNKKQGLATFLTILQLAAIEEVLGDWVNLSGHQKAAYDLLTRLYTPQTIVESDFLLKVLLWYIRFDLFVGFQSGGESVLGREWYVAVHDHYSQQARENPDSIMLKYEERFAYSRLVAKESSDLFARKAKGLITDEAFMEQLPILDEKIKNLEKIVDPVLSNPSFKVSSFPGKHNPDDIVNPYEPNLIWGGDLWTSNFLLFDTWGILFMYHISVAMALRKPWDPELTETAYRACQHFKAVCAYPGGLPGAIIEAQASMAIATLFLPRDHKTMMWCRRTFCDIESSGYIYSNILRNKMLEQWGLEHSDWWLPDDEGCRPIIRSIKDFITERTTAPKDQTSEDLREMKGIFTTLTISDSPPEDQSTSSPIEGALGSGGVPMKMDETIVYTGGSPDFDWNYDRKYSGATGYDSAQYPGQ